MKTQVIEKKGRQFAVVPLDEFEQLVQDAETLRDIRAYDAAKRRREEAFPSEVAKRLVSGENPIRVFRDYRGLTQEQLARSIKMARPYLAELEAGRKEGSIPVLKVIAKVLKLPLTDIV